MSLTPDTRSKAILLVEDNPQDEKLILRALARGRILNAVEVVRDGQQALDYLLCQGEFAQRAGEPPPAVVLLDIGLPRLSGLEVLEKIRADARTAHQPVVILTSSDDEQDRFESYKNGCNSFVRKPLNFGEFVETVSRLGVYWLAVNLPPAGK